MSMDLKDVYQIRVRGRLGLHWSDWFGGMMIAWEIGSDGLPVTTMTGAVPDQAALRGILCRLWDLNLTLVSVISVEMDSTD